MTTPSASQSKTSPLVIRSAIVASLGGLLFGFDTAVISGAEEKLKALYALSSFGEGMIVAIATIGTILGAIVAGRLADHFGRKPVLFWIGTLFGVGALATALAPTPDLVAGAGGAMTASSSMPITFFMVFRFLGGVGVGGVRAAGSGQRPGGGVGAGSRRRRRGVRAASGRRGEGEGGRGRGRGRGRGQRRRRWIERERTGEGEKWPRGQGRTPWLSQK